MRLSDIMSAAGLSIYAEAGLVVFLVAFVAIAIRAFKNSAESAPELARLPLDDADGSQELEP